MSIFGIAPEWYCGYYQGYFRVVSNPSLVWIFWRLIWMEICYYWVYSWYHYACHSLLCIPYYYGDITSKTLIVSSVFGDSCSGVIFLSGVTNLPLGVSKMESDVTILYLWPDGVDLTGVTVPIENDARLVGVNFSTEVGVRLMGVIFSTEDGVDILSYSGGSFTGVKPQELLLSVLCRV